MTFPCCALKKNRRLRGNNETDWQISLRRDATIKDGFGPVFDQGSLLTVGSIGDAKWQCSLITSAAGGPSSEPSGGVWGDAESQQAVNVASRHVACLPLVPVWQCGQWTGACATPQSSVEIYTVGPVEPAPAAGALWNTRHKLAELWGNPWFGVSIWCWWQPAKFSWIMKLRAFVAFNERHEIKVNILAFFQRVPNAQDVITNGFGTHVKALSTLSGQSEREV